MRWIIVDGIDGSGKSTVAHWMADRYTEEGFTVHLFVHPSERFLGRISKAALQSKGSIMHAIATMFFIADVLVSIRRKRKMVGPKDRVIFVRYLMGAAYLPECLMGIGYELFKRIIDLPSARMLVDVLPEVALARIEQRDHEREMFENIEGLRESRRKTLVLAEDGWSVLDNSGTVEATKMELKVIMDRWESS
jgi:dTMP kinase